MQGQKLATEKLNFAPFIASPHITAIPEGYFLRYWRMVTIRYQMVVAIAQLGEYRHPNGQGSIGR